MYKILYSLSLNVSITLSRFLHEQVVSVFLAVLATIACVSACIFSAMHLSRLMRLECTPARVLNATCICRPRGELPDSLEDAVRYTKKLGTN